MENNGFEPLTSYYGALQTELIPQYSWMDLNHLKAANLAEKVYKTSLTTKSHE